MWRYYSILTWRVWQDGGHGITNKSLRYFDSLKGKLGAIHKIHIDGDRQMSMEIEAINGVVLLSGVNCGYGGEGPHGTLTILEKLGIDTDILKAKVLNNNPVNITQDLGGLGSW